MEYRIGFFLTAYNNDLIILADFSKSTQDTVCHSSSFQELCGIPRHYCRKQMYFYGNRFNIFDIV